MTRQAPLFAGIVYLQLFTAMGVAHAQTGLSQAIEALPRVPVTDVLTAIQSGRLYGGLIDATIQEQDRDRDVLGAGDCIDFTLRSRDAAGPPAMHFYGPRTDATAGCGGTQGTFDEWTNAQAGNLLAIIFPSSLGTDVLGRSPAELYAQQFLLTTALAIDGVRRQDEGGRTFAGGLVEFESLRRDGRRPGDSGWALQGLVGVGRMVSIQGRFMGQREDVTSHATTISADFHPFIEIPGPVTWRFGGNARGGLLYSKSNALDLGSLEFGGGGWMSGFSDLGRVRLGGGLMLQGAKSYVPGMFGGSGDDLAFLADAINARPIQYDVAFGATACVDTSRRTRVIGKFVQNTPVSARNERSDSRLLVTGLSYSLGLPTLNVGYKLYSATAFTSHSIFVQGNYDW